MDVTQSQLADEAIQRAKAIAARLTGQPVPVTHDGTADANSTTSSTGKRKRWGLTPDDTDDDPNNNNNNSTQKLSAVQVELVSKRFWIATSEAKPPSHFLSYLTPRFEDCVESLRNNNDNNKASALSIVFHGRGSSSQPPPPGMPQEPLHVIVQGTAALVAQAQDKVHQLLLDAEEAPLEGVVTDADNTQALTTIAANRDNDTHSHALSSYRPASVAQMIGQANLPPETHGGPMLDDEILVPTGVVGFIIGRGGENITAMQAQTGVKVQIQKEHELVPGQTTRTILLQGATQESIDACKRIIEAKVQERVRSYNANQSSLQGATGLGGSGKDPKVEMALAAGHQLVEVQVPDADVGLIIGKMGATIKHIQATTGAAVQVPHAVPGEATRLLQITHPSQEGAEQAKRMVQELLDSKIHHQQNEAPSQTSVEVNIPDRDVGLCIGRQGCVIRHMQSVTNTRIQIPSQPMPGHTYRVATVTGTPEGCAEAKAMMERISHEQSSAGVLSGAPPSNGYGSQSAYYGQQQQQQQSHDANGVYSAEWAAYHAAQAAVAAAAAAQQPTVQSAPAAAVYSTPAAAPTTTTSATASQPAADAYYEQYFRYAYYYGDDAARQYYGAWSPPPGTPNPYGVNPNGITAAPAAAPVAASTSTTPAPAPASTVPDATDSAVRDTGRRKVSNLPAWMTNQN